MPRSPSLPILITASAVLLSVEVSSEPLFDPDGGPLTGLFGWPTSTEGSHLTGRGANRWRAHMTASSHSVMETAGDESIVLDGETTRLWLDWRRGLSGRFEVGMMIPWIWHESGNLDSVISDWHDFFGLPQGNRSAWPEDRLLFLYSRSGRAVERLDRNSNGHGDLRIHVGWLLREAADARMAVRFGIKLPTGDSDELLGSGSTDLSIGLAGDARGLLNLEALDGFYRVHLIYLGNPEIRPSSVRHLAGQLSGGLEYRFTPNISVGAQTTIRSAPFDAAVDPLGEWAMSLTAGARFRLPGDWQLALGFNEDVKVESVPDITFLASVSAPIH